DCDENLRLLLPLPSGEGWGEGELRELSIARSNSTNVSSQEKRTMTRQTFIRSVRDRLLTLSAGISITLLIVGIASRTNGTGYFGTIRVESSKAQVQRSFGFGIDMGALVVAWTREEV